MYSIDKVISKWNDCSQAYSDEMEASTLQSAITLYNLVSCNKASRIIDAGCGPGLSSQALASTVMKCNSTVYCVDIAEKMLDVFENRFKTNDFSRNPDNSFKRIDAKQLRSSDNMEAIEDEATLGPSGRRVFNLVADIEQLPFPDHSFDAYTANLVLQFTPNYLNVLVEAYRTLRENGKAAFSVWGREENCTFITFVPNILEKHGVEVDPEVYSSFDAIDTEQIMEDAKEIGFSSVKNYFFPTHYSIMSGEELWQMLNYTSAKKNFRNLDDDTLDKVKNDIIKEFDEKYGPNTDNMSCFEVEVILLTK
jgi:ubiquinone/menaquinone biosynthesis C-methylase UbiE